MASFAIILLSIKNNYSNNLFHDTPYGMTSSYCGIMARN